MMRRVQQRLAKSDRVAALRKEIEPYENRFNTKYWIGVPTRLCSIASRIYRVKRSTIFVTVYDDTRGKLLFPAKLWRLSLKSPALRFMTFRYLPGPGSRGWLHGLFRVMGASAADLALEILAGRSPSTIDPQPSQNRRFLG